MAWIILLIIFICMLAETSWPDRKWCWLKDYALLSELLLCVHFSVNERRLYIIYYDIFRSAASDLKGIYDSNCTNCTIFCWRMLRPFAAMCHPSWCSHSTRIFIAASLWDVCVPSGTASGTTATSLSAKNQVDFWVGSAVTIATGGVIYVVWVW